MVEQFRETSKIGHNTRNENKQIKKHITELKKKYAPAFDNYGQSCFHYRLLQTVITMMSML
jgi:hypothetical protein